MILIYACSIYMYIYNYIDKNVCKAGTLYWTEHFEILNIYFIFTRRFAEFKFWKKLHFEMDVYIYFLFEYNLTETLHVNVFVFASNSFFFKVLTNTSSETKTGHGSIINA